MLYIFHVDTGTMMTFDMNLAMENVSALQTVIAKACHISEEKQVLLISGGESLDPAARVCKYSAGTDTNPIYLFSKSTIEAATPPSPSVHYGSDVDLHSQVEGSLIMPPAYETVVSRAQLALQFQDVDQDELRACERLVHDQHLQQQGWAAVVANLEDISSALQRRSEIFQEAYKNYMEHREQFLQTLLSINDSLQLLSKIPLLPCLHNEKVEPMSSSFSMSAEELDKSKNSLFDWINSQDPHHSLQDMVDQCKKVIDQFDDQVLNAILMDVEQTFEAVSNQNMKEVKGLEDRLYGLDQIMSGARRLVTEQKEMSQGFVQNQNRLSNLRDNTILPDLCASHRKQLLVMLNNHKKLREIKRKCRLAKEDLSVNLHTRLRWVMFVEKKICDVDGKLMIYHENLKRLKKRLDILLQIETAPKVYAMLVVEVVRRRQFSSKYFQWASNIASESSHVQKEEIRRRQEFFVNVGQHFLQSLFHGFEDFSVTFARESPSPFDQNLPKITQDDVDMLRTHVPELEGVLRLPVEELSKWIDLPTGESFQINLGFDMPSQNIVISGTTSDIDIIQSCGDVMPGEASLDLGQQVAACESEAGILIQPKSCPESPTVKTEFLVPRSLSETLTEEMRDQSKVHSSECKDTKEETEEFKSLPVEGTSEQLEIRHSTGSDGSQHSVVRSNESLSSSKKTTSKGPISDTSPEIETSQEFTTADFYFDESMPSSIASSPPNKPGTEEKKPAAKMLQEKATLIEKYQKELQDYQVKLSSANCKLKTLQQLLEKSFPEVQDTIRSTSQLLENQRQVFFSNLESTKQSLLQTVLAFQSSLSTSNEEHIEKLKCEFEETEKKLQEKLDTSKAEVSKLENENKQIQNKMDDIVKEFENDKIKFDSQMADRESQYKTAIEQMVKEHSLELEVEMDRVRSEFQTQVDSQEEQLKDKNEKIVFLEEKLEKMKNEKVKMEEDLTRQYQQEKEEIQAILQLEYMEKTKQALSAEQKTLEEKYNSEKVEMDKKHQSLLDQKLSELKVSSDSEQQKALETLQLTLEAEHQHRIKEMENNLKKEVEEHSKMLEKKLSEEHSEEMEKCQVAFALQKENLMLELKKFTDKTFSEGEVQTDMLPETIIKDEHNKILQAATDDLRSQIKVLEERLSGYTNRMFSTVDMQTAPLPPSLIKEEHDNILKKTEENYTAKVESLSKELEKFTLREFSTCEIQTDDLPESFTKSEHEFIIGDLRDGLRKEMEHREEEHHLVIKDLQEKFRIEKESLCDEFRKNLQAEAVSCDMQTDDTPESILKTEHEQIVKNLQAEWQGDLQKEMNMKYACQKEEEIKKALQEQQAQHDRDIEALIAKVEKDKDDSLSSVRKSFTAEKQVTFNEALAKVVKEKERLMEELEQTKALLDTRSQEVKDTVDKLNEEVLQVRLEKDQVEKSADDNKKKAMAAQRQLEDELEMKKQQLSLYQQQIQDMSDVQMSTIQPSPSQSQSQAMLDIRHAVRSKNQEISKLNQRVMELSMTTSTRSVVQDKVSITSCNIGDLILLCLDERHDQYIVFTIGTTLHFLHSDCLELLGLKTNPGESRKSWVLAEITEKEYCQAKKPQNRFKVPVGTKFYRVKAKPWVRENTKQDAAAKAK
ncbi:hypothetical protein ScPMuIL_006533 [Solemya velum]